MDPKVTIMLMGLAVLQMGVATLQIIREVFGLRQDAQEAEDDES